MQFNIIFKTIFEYIHDKFCFVHTCTNTFCKYRKKLLASPRVHLVNDITRCTRGDARSFFCTYKMYLYAQNYFLKNVFKYCFKSYIKLHEYANCNSANYDV